MDSTKLLDDEAGIEPARDMEMSDEMSAPMYDEIAELAYSYWEGRGREGGSPIEDWLRAEREIQQRESQRDEE
jgi:hypothetical protein